jgi:hypothetical protein
LDRALPRGAYTVELLVFRLPSWDSIPARAEPRREAPPVPLTAGPIAVMPTGALPPLDTTPKRPIGARFGGQIELLGVDRLERTADAIDLSLLWRAETRPERDYSVFVHALDSAGKLVAQSDGYPWSGAYPTGAWEPDQPVSDSYHLVLPPNTTGPLRLVAGLYRLDTGERLKAGGADAVEVGRLDS